jgi:hypothetical protein
MSHLAHEFRRFDAEAYLARRLKDSGDRVFAGITDPKIRMERFRRAIIDGGHACAIAGRSLAGKSETYAQLFERMYGQPLIAITPTTTNPTTTTPTTNRQRQGERPCHTA